MPLLVEILERHGELILKPAVKVQVCTMSPATIDHLLRPHRQLGLRIPFSTTKPGSLLKAVIPLRTFADWNEHRPSFLEIDLVAQLWWTRTETTYGLLRDTWALPAISDWVSGSSENSSP